MRGGKSRGNAREEGCGFVCRGRGERKRGKVRETIERGRIKVYKVWEERRTKGRECE